MVDPIKNTADFILDNALHLLGTILAFPVFLIMLPLMSIATSGIFKGPAPRSNSFVQRMNKIKSIAQADHTAESQQAAMGVSQEQYEKMYRELNFEEGKVHIAIIGGTGVGKSSLVNAFRGLKDKAPDAAPVGEKDCTKTATHYVDPRFPWIVWFDIPGAGTQDRSTTTYFEEQGLFLMDFVLVVCSSRVKELDMAILKRAHHYGIPAGLVRSKADQDLLQRAKRECDDSDDEDEIKSNMKRVKPAYVKEIKEDLMNEVKTAGLDGYVTPKNCFLVSAKILRGLMIATKELPVLKGLDESSYQSKLAEIKAAVKKHIKKIFAKADEIDEKSLLEMVFTSVAQRRYNTN